MGRECSDNRSILHVERTTPLGVISEVLVHGCALSSRGATPAATTGVGRMTQFFAGRLLARSSRSFLRDLLLQRFEVEARALLYRRELDKGLRHLGDLLLHVDEAPELVGEPILVEERSLQARTFK